jgi:hypothetical protein
MPNFLQVDTLIDEQDGNLSAGDLSLREAIDAIDSGGFIAFAPGLAGTIALDPNLGSLLIRKNMTIVGNGAKQLAVSGNNATRVFTIDDGVDGNFLTVGFEGLTIRNGKTGNGSGLEISGGGILNLERLTLSNSMVLNNESANGGGIYNSGTLDVFNSTIANNVAGTGGGLMNGPSNTGRIGSTNLFSSTVSSNRAAGIGGIVNVVQAPFQGVLRLNNSTITNNQGTFGTGGIFSQNAVLTDSSIIAGNRSEQTTPDVTGSFVSQGYNLVGQVGSATGFGATGDQVGTAAAPIDPRFGPLQDNGGPTLTHALLAGSPAIDAGRPGFAGIQFDQRGAGFARVVDGNGDGSSVIDIGAFEVQEPPLNVINGTSGKDFLQGTVGRDEINGLGGADILIGKASSDLLNGGDGVDTLIGVDPQINQPGLGEIDRLNGGNNSDLFVLGDNRRVYYDDGNAATAGEADYGLIADFSRGDLIVLKGRPSNYRLDETRSLGGQSGTAILLKNGSSSVTDEVIGFVANVTGLNLERRSMQFLYV